LGVGERAFIIAAAIVANAHVPPEAPHADGAKKHVRVVKLVIVANPGADESPGSLDSGISAETGNLLGLALKSWAGPKVLWGETSD